MEKMLPKGRLKNKAFMTGHHQVRSVGVARHASFVAQTTQQTNKQASNQASKQRSNHANKQTLACKACLPLHCAHTRAAVLCGGPGVARGRFGMPFTPHTAAPCVAACSTGCAAAQLRRVLKGAAQQWAAPQVVANKKADTIPSSSCFCFKLDRYGTRRPPTPTPTPHPPFRPRSLPAAVLALASG